MLDLKKVARQIKEEGLYSFIYNEMKEVSKKEELSEEEILLLLKENPKFLDDYKTLNTQSEISNIQLIEQKIELEDSEECKRLKEKLNRNRKKLLSLEAYEKEPDHMLYAVWIGSVVVFLIFVIHNLVVLYTYWYEHYPLFVYGMYLLSIAGGVFFYRKKVKNHWEKYKQFQLIAKETKTLIKEGKETGCLKKIYE